MSTIRRYVVCTFLLLALLPEAGEATVLFQSTVTIDGVALTPWAQFTISDHTLTLEIGLIGGDIHGPSQQLAAVLWSLPDGVTLVSPTAVLASLASFKKTGGCPCGGTDVDGEFAFASGSAVLSPFVLVDAGVGAVGFDLAWAANPIDPTSNLHGAGGVDGPNFMITSHGDNVVNNAGPVFGSVDERPIIQGDPTLVGGTPTAGTTGKAVVFTFTINSHLSESQIGDVTYQFGTGLEETCVGPGCVSVPVPPTLLLLAAGVTAACLRRIRRK